MAKYLDMYFDDNPSMRTQNAEIRFNKVSDFEKIAGKDLCDFGIMDILAYYKLINTTSMEFLLVINSSFKDYTNYCLKNSLVVDGQNHFEEIDYDTLKQCLNIRLAEQSIINRKELNKICDELANPSDQFIVKAIFEGICGTGYDEISTAKYSDISGNTFNLATGRKVEISDELKALAKKSSDMYDYYCYTKGGDYKVASFDISDDHIIKRMYNARVDVTDRQLSQRMKTKIDRIRISCGSNAIRMKNLKESGRIDMIKRLYVEGNYKTYRECILANFDEISERYGKLASVNRYIIKYFE